MYFVKHQHQFTFLTVHIWSANYLTQDDTHPFFWSCFIKKWNQGFVISVSIQTLRTIIKKPLAIKVYLQTFVVLSVLTVNFHNCFPRKNLVFNTWCSEEMVELVQFTTYYFIVQVQSDLEKMIFGSKNKMLSMGC